MTGPELEQIATLVRERTGLVFPDSRTAVIAVGVRRAMAAAQMSAAARYLMALEQSPTLLDDLFAELTVGETYFFREPAQLDYVRREVFPRLRRLGRRVRMWSAGCATGEEPYTLSMMAHEADLAHGASILGTDLSRARLRLAQRGIYRQWSMRGVPQEAVRQFFTVGRETYEVAPVVRAPVEFRYLNLTADQFPSPALGVWGMDVIFCRNVLIYFDEESVALVAAKLLETLTEDGWLFLGASDPLLSEVVSCDVVITSAGLAYRRPRVARSTMKWSVMETTPGTAPTLVTPQEMPPATPEKQWPELLSADPVSPLAPGDMPPRSESVTGAALRDITPPRPSAQAWIDRVRQLANLGHLREADAACTAALDQYRASAELTYLHAVLLGEAGHHADAAAAARRALYLDRTLVVAHLALGSALRRIGDLDGALRAFTNAVVLLDRMAPDAIVPASGGEPAARLAAAARVQLTLAEVAA